MKKLIFLLSVALLSTTIVACGNRASEKKTSDGLQDVTADVEMSDEQTIPDETADENGNTDGEKVESDEANKEQDKTDDFVVPDVIYDENDGIYVINLGGVDVSKATLSYYLFGAKRSYPDAAGELVAEKALYELKCDIATEILAENCGVVISEKDRREKIERPVFETVAAYENMQNVTYTEALSYVRMTDTVFRQLRENTVLQELIYETCYAPGSGGEHITDEKIVEHANADYTRIKHILIPTADLDEQMKIQAKRDAEEILQMTADTPFEELVEAYSRDSRMNTDTGYYLTRNSTVPEVEERAFELEIGKISDIVESAYGYHIIKRYPIDGQQILSDTKIRTELSEEICKNAFWDDLGRIADSLYVQYYDNYYTVLSELIS